MDRRPRVGIHISISGGFEAMAARARDFGLETIQVFSRSPRGGRPREIGPAEAEASRKILAEASIHPLVIHTPYFVNLCASDPSMRDYGVETVVGELERAALLGAPYVVTHLGRPAAGVEEEEALEIAGSALAEVLARRPGASGSAPGVMLLIENTAGAGNEVGSALEGLASLVDRLGSSPGTDGSIGVCLDTCHAHAAGYDLSTAAGVANFADLARRLFGEAKVRVVHANDSAGEAGSHHDRHAAIGEGTIGTEGFRALLRDPLLARCPFLLETSGSDAERAEGAKRLRALREG